MPVEELFGDFCQGPGSGKKHNPQATSKLYDDGRRKLERQTRRQADEQRKLTFSPAINKTSNLEMQRDVFSRLSSDNRLKRQQERERREAAKAEQDRAKKQVPPKQVAQHAQRLYEIGVRKQKQRAGDPRLDKECSFSPQLTPAAASSPSPNTGMGNWVQRLYDPNRFEQMRKEKELTKEARQSAECTYSPQVIGAQYSPDAQPNREGQANGKAVHERLFQDYEKQQRKLLEQRQKKEQTELAECSFQPFKLEGKECPVAREDVIVERLALQDVDRRREREHIVNNALPRNCTFMPERVSRDIFHDEGDIGDVHTRLYNLSHERAKARNAPTMLDDMVDQINRLSATKPDGEWRSPPPSTRVRPGSAQRVRPRRARSLEPSGDAASDGPMMDNPLAQPRSGLDGRLSQLEVFNRRPSWPEERNGVSSPSGPPSSLSLDEVAEILAQALDASGTSFAVILKVCNCPVLEPMGHSELQHLLRVGFHLSTTQLPFTAIKTLFKHLDGQTDGYGFTPEALGLFIGVPEPEKVQPKAAAAPAAAPAATARPVARPVARPAARIAAPAAARAAAEQDGTWQLPVTKAAIKIANERKAKAALPAEQARRTKSARPAAATPASPAAAPAAPVEAAPTGADTLPTVAPAEPQPAVPPPVPPAAQAEPPHELKPQPAPQADPDPDDAPADDAPAPAPAPAPTPAPTPAAAGEDEAFVPPALTVTKSKSGVSKMSGPVMRPNAKGTGWVSRWLETGGTSKTGDVICCYTDQKKSSLLNAMKLHMASDIVALTEEEAMGEQGIFVIRVNEKEYPFKADTMENAVKWADFLNQLRSDSAFSKRRGSTMME